MTPQNGLKVVSELRRSLGSCFCVRLSCRTFSKSSLPLASADFRPSVTGFGRREGRSAKLRDKGQTHSPQPPTPPPPHFQYDSETITCFRGFADLAEANLDLRASERGGACCSCGFGEMLFTANTTLRCRPKHISNLAIYQKHFFVVVVQRSWFIAP